MTARTTQSRGRIVARLARILLCHNPLRHPFHRLTQEDVEMAWSNASHEHRETSKSCARRILKLLEDWS